MITILIINGILYTDIIKTPNLWRLLKTLVPDGEKNPQLVLALTVIFKGHLNSQNLLATQLGMYLNSNGVKDAVITQMNRLGLSISIDSIQRRLQLLTIKQKQLIFDRDGLVQASALDRASSQRTSPHVQSLLPGPSSMPSFVY